MIVNEYEITERRYIKWVFESKLAGRKLGFLILWCVLLLVCVLAFALSKNDYLYLVFALYCLYRAALRDLLTAKAFYKRKISSAGDKWIRTIKINEDELEILDANSEVRYKLSDIVKATSNEERIRLFMNDKTSVRLYKASFVEGDVAQNQYIQSLLNK